MAHPLRLLCGMSHLPAVMPRRRHAWAASTTIAILLLSAACRPGGPDADPAETEAIAEEETQDSVYGTPAPQNIRVTRVEIDIPDLPDALDGYRIAAISDLNVGPWTNGLTVARTALERAAEEADLVALLGGFFGGQRNHELLLRVLEPVQGRNAVAVLSAGDLGPPGSEQIRAELAETLSRAGVQLLRNRRALVERGGDTLHVAGLDGDAYQAADWRRAEMIRAIGAEPRVHVLLTASPLVAPRFPEDRYGLVLAGGTSCGEVGLPGRASLRRLQEETLAPFRMNGQDRYFYVDGNAVFITCGVGHTFLPTGLAGPPEITIATLRTAIIPVEAEEDDVDVDLEDLDEGVPAEPAEPEAEPME